MASFSDECWMCDPSHFSYTSALEREMRAHRKFQDGHATSLIMLPCACLEPSTQVSVVARAVLRNASFARNLDTARGVLTMRTATMACRARAAATLACSSRAANFFGMSQTSQTSLRYVCDSPKEYAARELHAKLITARLRHAEVVVRDTPQPSFP